MHDYTMRYRREAVNWRELSWPQLDAVLTELLQRCWDDAEDETEMGELLWRGTYAAALDALAEMQRRVGPGG